MVNSFKVDDDEVETVKAVHIYYCPVFIDGTQYSARMVVKEYYQGSQVINELHLYNVMLKKRHQTNTLSQDGTPHMRSDASTHYKVSDLIHNTQELDQIHSSKIVDANGEPMPVYHQTNATLYVNRETGEVWDDLDWRTKQEWDERDDWEEYWIEQPFYSFDLSRSRVHNEIQGIFFAPEYDEYHEYGDRTITVFLNMRNPTDFNTSYDGWNEASAYSTSDNPVGIRQREKLQEQGIVHRRKSFGFFSLFLRYCVTL